MIYKEFPPPPELADFVQAFWIMEDNGSATENKVYRILPFCCPRIVFHNQNYFQKYPATSSNSIIPTAVLNGHTYHYQEYAVRGKFQFVGAYLYPFVPSLLFGVSAGDYFNRVVELESFLKEPVRSILHDRVMTASNNGERIASIVSFLKEKLTKVRYETNPLYRLILEIINRKGNISVKELTTMSGLSTRQLDRKFNSLVGMTPKLFSRIVRFQSSLALNRAGTSKNLTSLALEAGYYDQAHFIHEFKHFAGFSPSFYFNRHRNSTADIMCAITR